MKSTSGFTLIELMTTLTVAAVLLTVGVPSFQEFVKSNTLSARVNGFVSDLNFARSEAIKRGGRVTMCKSSDLAACTTSGGWEQGWIVFSDMAGTAGTVDIGAGDTIVRSHVSSGGSITIRGNTNVSKKISFASSGVLDSSPGSLIFCDDRIKTFSTDKHKARAVVISMIGRIRTTKGNDSSLSISTCTPS